MVQRTVALSFVQEGKKCRVKAIEAGRGLVRRLREMGFNENVVVEVVKSNGIRGVIVQLNNSRFALSRGMSMKIIVEEL
ncbi:MAG TPA: ferrous iron transport protein A [Thermoplasmata archaeon]|nr:ferrous iron transport protein A [Thermoplasmata archaeon]